MKVSIEENQNAYALNLLGETVFIAECKSGRKGYFCLGCGREMQAVKSSKGIFFPYFRHDSNASKGKPKCTYRDETYRHRLAKEILMIEKSIKVPRVFKFPPEGIEGKPNLLIDSQIVTASFVKSELPFFEDDNCEIKWGVVDDNLKKHLLIRPDITFFDNEWNPILLIEIVATHKIDDEKFLKLQRLGLDTIQVTIPRVSLQEINKFNKHTKFTKWVFNHVEQKTTYFPVSESDSTGILSIDELPESIFKESFKCRSAQIRELIRRITKCLESEHYKQARQHIESEIQRVKISSERIAKEQEDHRRICREKWESINRNELEKIRIEEGEIERVERELEQKNTSLEGRYRSRKYSIGEEKRRIENESNLIFGPDGKTKFDLESTIFENERVTREIERDNERRRASIERIIKDKNRLRNEIELNQIEESRRIESIRERIEKEQNTIVERRKAIPRELQKNASDLQREFEARRSEYCEKIYSGESNKHQFFPNTNSRLIEEWKLLNDFKINWTNLKRARSAYECIKSGAYKNWEE